MLEYLASAPVRALLHDAWGRTYTPFAERPPGWLAGLVGELVGLRLLERVGRAGAPAPGGATGGLTARGSTPRPAPHGQTSCPWHPAGPAVVDAHPLVRRAFEGSLGPAGRRQGSGARAGFLRGRPGRRRPATLTEAREEVELFHAYCDAGLWDEADGALVALENPKHRLLAPALERDLLLRFFPGGDWRRPPLWPGFGRWRSLAICFEMLGAFDDALEAYRPADAALRGDALLARGRLGPLLGQQDAPPPWQALWRAYRCHALALAGRPAEALALARSLVPVDVYEWAHVFECLLRCGALGALDLGSVLFRPPGAAGHAWAELARVRMRADYLRVTAPEAGEELGEEYRALLEAYDRAGLPWER